VDTNPICNLVTSQSYRSMAGVSKRRHDQHRRLSAPPVAGTETIPPVGLSDASGIFYSHWYFGIRFSNVLPILFIVFNGCIDICYSQVSSSLRYDPSPPATLKHDIPAVSILLINSLVHVLCSDPCKSISMAIAVKNVTSMSVFCISLIGIWDQGAEENIGTEEGWSNRKVEKTS
jgi:hypothetical protein